MHSNMSAEEFREMIEKDQDEFHERFIWDEVCEDWVEREDEQE